MQPGCLNSRQVCINSGMHIKILLKNIRVLWKFYLLRNLFMILTCQFSIFGRLVSVFICLYLQDRDYWFFGNPGQYTEETNHPCWWWWCQVNIFIVGWPGSTCQLFQVDQYYQVFFTTNTLPIVSHDQLITMQFISVWEVCLLWIDPLLQAWNQSMRFLLNMVVRHNFIWCLYFTMKNRSVMNL